MKITFREFRDFLFEAGCSEAEVCHLYRALPDAEVEGVTAGYLVEKCGYKPLNAFIVLDWLKADPQAAKYFVLKLPSTISPSDSIGQEVSERMRREGREAPPLEAVDERDILE